MSTLECTDVKDVQIFIKHNANLYNHPLLNIANTSTTYKAYSGKEINQSKKF